MESSSTSRVLTSATECSNVLLERGTTPRHEAQGPAMTSTLRARLTRATLAALAVLVIATQVAAAPTGRRVTDPRVSALRHEIVATLAQLRPLLDDGERRVLTGRAHLAGSLCVIRDVVRDQVESYEIIVIDDGSPDETWSVLTELRSQIPELRRLDFEVRRPLRAGWETA